MIIENIDDKTSIARRTTSEVIEGEILNLMSFFNKTKEEIQNEWFIWETQDFEHWQYRDYGDYGRTKFVYTSNLYINKNNDIISIGEESARRYVHDYLSTEMFRNLVDNEKFREEYEALIGYDPFSDLVDNYLWYHNLYTRKGFWDYLHPKSKLSIDGYGNELYLLIRNPLKIIDLDTYVLKDSNRLLVIKGLNESGTANTKWLKG